MFVFYSFGPGAFDLAPSLSAHRSDHVGWLWDGKQRSTNVSSTYHNVAFFVTAGVLANFLSQSVMLLYRLPLALSTMQKMAITTRSSARAAMESGKIPTILPSLGASGAIYSTMSLTALAYPKSSVYLIFFPFVPIKIGYAMSGVFAFEIIGILRGWRFFDHWAHLSGAAFGAIAFYQEAKIWNEVQQTERKLTSFFSV